MPIRFPDTRFWFPFRKTPLAAFPEMRFRSFAELPPIILPGDTVQIPLRFGAANSPVMFGPNEVPPVTMSLPPLNTSPAIGSSGEIVNNTAHTQCYMLLPITKPSTRSPPLCRPTQP